MISIEQARKRILGLDTRQIRELTKNRLLGVDSTPFGSGHSYEPSEDLIIQILLDSNLEESTREGVITACEDVYAKLLAWLGSSSYEENIANWQDILIRISRVVDVTAPVEVMGHANSILALALKKCDKLPEILGAAVRACMGYKDKSMLPMWEQIINQYSHVAAYAFNALLKIEPRSIKIEEYLKTLWRRQLVDGWPVDTAFLMRRAARVRNERALIYRVLLKLKNSDLSLWEKVEKELKEPWSQQWLANIKEILPSMGRLKKHDKAHFTMKWKRSIPMKFWAKDYAILSGKRRRYIFIAETEGVDYYIHDYVGRLLSRLEERGYIEFGEKEYPFLEEINNVSGIR